MHTLITNFLYSFGHVFARTLWDVLEQILDLHMTEKCLCFQVHAQIRDLHEDINT